MLCDFTTERATGGVKQEMWEKPRADANTYEESLYCIGDDKQALSKQGQQIFIQKESFLWMFAIPSARC